MKNKKGFTLVELLAVIVILLVIVLIAVNVINDKIKKAEKNSVEVNANNYIKAVNGVASLSQNIGEDMEKGTYQVRQLNKTDIKISGEKPRKGFLVLQNYEVIMGCLTYDKYSAFINNGRTSEITRKGCDDYSFAENFAYTGSEQIFISNLSGTYKLEVWGASGGEATSYNGVEVLPGGYGGYSVGEYYLNQGDKLYINVGGKGVDNYLPESGEGVVAGGYNGGGTATGYAQSPEVNNVISGSGGGASHIALRSGLLSTFDSNRDDLIMVAGGGGGASSHRYNNAENIWRGTGGNGGGFNSTVGLEYGRNKTGTYATQTTGGCGYNNNSVYLCGTFGTGANATTGTSCGGGGGGYYGGGVSQHGGTSGGSGYIANQSLFNKSMYCYGCTTNDGINGKTVSNQCVNSDPKEKCSKKGNGHVKITYVGEENTNPYSHLTVYYDHGIAKQTINTYHNFSGYRASLNSDKITLGSSSYTLIYTDPIDLSRYNSVIIKRTPFNNLGRSNLSQYPDIVNNSGDGLAITWTSLNYNNYYVGDLSGVTRSDLRLRMDQYQGDGSGDIFFIGFSTKTVSEIVANHSYLN